MKIKSKSKNNIVKQEINLETIDGPNISKIDSISKNIDTKNNNIIEHDNQNLGDSIESHYKVGSLSKSTISLNEVDPKAKTNNNLENVTQ